MTEQQPKVKNCIYDKAECCVIIAKKEYYNTNFHYVHQCITCGHQLGTPIAASKVENKDSVPFFDESINKRFTEEYFKPQRQLSEMRRLQYNIVLNLKVEYYKKHFNIDYYSQDKTFEGVYEAYLASPEWQERRQKIFERDNHTCVFCKTAKAVQVHHVEYRNLALESDFELLSVCVDCHGKFHEEEKRRVEQLLGQFE